MSCSRKGGDAATDRSRICGGKGRGSQHPLLCGGGLSPLQQHINTSSTPPSSTIPVATDLTIKSNPNLITSSNSSTNLIADPCLSPSAANSTVTAHVAAAGALLAANQAFLPHNLLSRCAAGPGQRSAPAHTNRIWPLFLQPYRLVNTADSMASRRRRVTWSALGPCRHRPTTSLARMLCSTIIYTQPQAAELRPAL